MPRRLGAIRRRLARLNHFHQECRIQAETRLVRALRRLRRSRTAAVELVIESSRIRFRKPAGAWRIRSVRHAVEGRFPRY